MLWGAPIESLALPVFLPDDITPRFTLNPIIWIYNSIPRPVRGEIIYVACHTLRLAANFSIARPGTLP